MKNKTLICIVLVGLIFLIGCGHKNDSSTPTDTGFTIDQATLEGSQVVPPVPTNARAGGVLFVNTFTSAVTGSVTLNTALSTKITAVHVHEGARGVNGPVVLTLDKPGNEWTVLEGEKLTADQVLSFEKEQLYFDVHTEAYPDGEIRGQIEGIPQNAPKERR